MNITPPVAAAQAGQSYGGGFIDSIKAAVSGGAAPASATQTAGPKGDGSVGLMDGVLKKAAISGVAGAAFGFLPFLPGGPILGGIVGALGGAAMAAFGNWSKMKTIKAENEAALAAYGVQVNDPQVQEILKSGNVEQLMPLLAAEQAAQGAPAGSGVATQQAGQYAAQTQQLPATPAIGSTEAAQQSPIPTQAGAVNPNVGVDPGVAPALVTAGGATVQTAQLAETITSLQAQIDALKAVLESLERAEAPAAA